jgi:cell division protein ZapC
MCIQPNDNWQWHYDAHDDRLMLDLSDRMIFATEYKGRQLVPSSFTVNSDNKCNAHGA